MLHIGLFCIYTGFGILMHQKRGLYVAVCWVDQDTSLFISTVSFCLPCECMYIGVELVMSMPLEVGAASGFDLHTRNQAVCTSFY